MAQCIGFVAQDEFAKLTHGHTLDGWEIGLVVGFQDQARYVILFRRDERVRHNLLKRHIGQRELGGHALLFGSRRQPRQLVTGLFFIGLGKKVSQVTELKAFVHFPSDSHYPPKAKSAAIATKMGS
jgi:hypothetical protein